MQEGKNRIISTLAAKICIYVLLIFRSRFEPNRQEITIPDDPNSTLRLDISLMRDDPQHWSSAHDFRILKHVLKTVYNENEKINSEMAELAHDHFEIAAYNYRDADYQVEYPSLKITSNVSCMTELFHCRFSVSEYHFHFVYTHS